jgi:4-carboxymuconolactone decarboxylase
MTRLVSASCRRWRANRALEEGDILSSDVATPAISDLQEEIAMTRDIYEDGLTIRRKMLGDAWVDRSLANRNDFNAEIQQQITRQAWGEVWTRPGIDLKTRRFMAMSIMIALRAWDEFRLHVRSGLTQGDLTKDELKEIIIQATAYCGAPAGNHAMQQAELAFKEP